MMNSNLLARFRLPANEPTTTSIYETIRQENEDSEESDVEGRAGFALDRRNLAEVLDQFDDVGSSPESARQPLRGYASSSRKSSPRATRKTSRPRWVQQGRDLVDVEEADDDVPASLLIEGGVELPGNEREIPLPPRPSSLSPRVDRHTQLQWEQTQAAQNLHPPTSRPRGSSGLNAFALADPKEKAMWRWINTQHLDKELHNVYFYFINNGFWSIILKRIFALATMAFMVGFSLFLTQCVDYRNARGSTGLSEILVPQCTKRMGFLPNLLLWVMTFFWVYKLVSYILDIPRLIHMHEFYLHLLNVTEDEIQSISWQEIVARLMALRDSHPNIVAPQSRSRHAKHDQNKQRMDAHDIANRLMRRDNYMVAMINKDILDMTLPIPGLRNRQLFTTVMEWNLDLCITRWLFNNETGQLSTTFLKDVHRKRLSDGLTFRFRFAAVMNFLVAPFIITYALLENFFANFNEYQKNPSQIGSRQYNVLAQWKFREFNELYHLFQRRLNMSHPFATRYINQFPKDKTVQAARFVTFVSGAIVSVLGLATILDQENFLSFEITPGRTTIFYLGIFGSIWAVARGLLPDDNIVYDSSYSMEEVIDFTHYRPSHWEGRLHTVEVKKEFERLYQMQILIFAEEVLSMIFTPLVLWFSLPKCSDQIIDFYREFTVHVDGVGYVCSFAEFNFKKPGNTLPSNTNARAPGTVATDLRDEYFATKDQKLEQSYWGFMNDYARNPKTEVRFNYRDSTANLNRKKFNMPPPFPGLLSPVIPADYADQNRENAAMAVTTGAAMSRQSQIFSPVRRAVGFNQGQLQGGISPLQSILLDPHHQPSGSGFGLTTPPASNRLRPTAPAAGKRKSNSRVKPSMLAREETAETVEEVAHPSASQPDQQLKEVTGSWKYPEDMGDVVSSDEDDDDNIDALTGGNGGVLGLIQTLKRVSGGGETGGVGGGVGGV